MPHPFPSESGASQIEEIEDLARLSRDLQGPEQEAAFTRLFEMLYPVVVRDIRWRVADLQTAEDLGQEVWVKVARSMTTYEGRGGGFLSWLLTIARNTVVEHHRATKRRAPETLSPDMWMLALLPAAEAGPAERAERRDLALRVARCIERLPPTHRDVLRNRFFSNLTYEQTAAVMGKRVSWVKVNQHRALAKLATLMPASDSGMAEYVLSPSSVGDTVSAQAGA